MNVLVVDAAAAVRSRLVSLLVEGGVTVIGEAASSRHASAFARLHGPDAVVLDVDMPDRGGLALIAELRATAPAMTVLVMTNALAYRRHCMQLGAHAFLDKSSEFSIVVDTLRLARSRT